MLTFLTLFLGLVYDVHPVELSVSAEVAAVELHLNGEQIGKLTGEPWSRDCDFGDTLRPHELVAVAHNASGEEVARARQWINLPRSHAEAVLVLTSGTEGSPPFAKLAWEAVGGTAPQKIVVTLNDQPIEVKDPTHIALPPHDLNQIQLLAAELTFPDGLQTRTELVFGGAFGDQVSTEMTAVPLTRSRKRRAKTMSADQLSTTLTKNGIPLLVLASEAGRAQVVIVQDPSAQLMLGTIGLNMDRLGTAVSNRNTRLNKGEQVRVISTKPARLASAEVPYDLFPISRGFGAEDGNLPYLLTHLMISGESSKSKVADAVAVGAVHAAATNQPRAVVLILGPDRDSDASRFSVAQVREYLTSLRVPLVVWAAGQVQSKRVSEDRMPMAHNTPWGKARDISSNSRLLAAVSELRNELDNQWIVWVEGSHLPQDIQLAQGTKGLELAR